MGFRYYPTISELNAADYGASAGLSVKPLGGRSWG